jgi:hypothetical protein
VPSSGRYDAGHEGWSDQVAAFVGELARVGTVTRAEPVVPGAKGTAGTFLVTLASAGSVTALIEVVRVWLARDRSRSLQLSWDEEGRLRSLSIDTSASEEELVPLVRSLRAEVGEEP